ncbi:MAG: undecaprenyldiphospho-muramoylpentapeptide beta-N-acetylglucosaminyltransferase [Spirochaetales bacterium]|nr:undecaprenyldiphospho-muramoylpentapeptide beta-N-acetylglucosaminyltransferase [Spirochaetales bacterium]
MKKTIIFTGGGTAGHVFPGIAVLRCLQERWSGNILWLGSVNGMERGIIRREALPFLGIPSGKLRRYLSFKNFLDLFWIFFGFVFSFFILLWKRPVLLFSKGGYVTVPPVIVSRLLNIPVITHESDFDPGLANRINAPFAKRILTSFEETASFLGPLLARRVICTGNPVRPVFEKADAAKGRAIVNCPESLPLVVVIGGSLGALAVNEAIEKILPQLADKCFIYHQMGAANYHASHGRNYRTVAFVAGQMEHILAAADCVISRAGSNMLYELAVLGKASILIPLPTEGSRGDQLRNAAFFQSKKAAYMICQEKGFENQVLEKILFLLDNKEQRELLSSNIRALARPEAAEKIAMILMDFMKE